MGVRLNLFGSRVASRVFVSFMLAALLPLAVLLFLVLRQVGDTLEARAYDQLGTASRGYGQLVLDKLISAADVLESVGARSSERPEVHIRDLLTVVESGPGDAAMPDVEARRQPPAPGRPALWVEAGKLGEEPRITLVGGGDKRTLLGRVDPGYLWTAAGVIGDDMEVCVFGGQGMAVLHCSEGAPPAAVAELMHQMHGSSGTLEWLDGDTRWLSAYWELFVGSRFNGEPWYIVVSEPRTDALAALATFNRIVPQVVALSAALIVLLSITQIRRTLGPLKQLLAGTQRIGEQDFDARVEVTGEDEFGALGEAMNAMAERLGRQFNRLRTLAQVDSLILSSQEIGRVLETVLGHVQALLPGGAVSVLLIDTEDPSHGRLHRPTAPAGTGGGLHRVPVHASLRAVLAERPEGWITDVTALRDLGLDGVFDDGPPGQQLHIMPLAHGGETAGALLSALPRGSETERATLALSELAGRLSVALVAGQRERELFQRAHFDALTGLPNRQLYYDRLGQAVAQARREEHRLAVLFIDLDGFKNVNDSVGHWAGDALLAETARRLTSALRDGDTVARLGGDEYAVILPRVETALEAEAMADSILSAVAKPFAVEGQESFVTASIGITLFPEDGLTAEELLRKADTAMYSAKDGGRARAAFFAREMDDRVQERHELTTDLRTALDHGELFLLYQPQVAFRDRRIVGVEALLRWRHPKRGLVPAGVFVPILEDIGMIETVGSWVLRTALTDYAAWRQDGLSVARVAVNVSARQLASPGFVPFVKTALRGAGLTGEHLEVELTEATLIADAEAANTKLKELAELGVRVALDDFGTGYSSLGYLNDLVCDTLKIDRAFVINLPDERSTAIVRAILAVAKTLGKEVVAEGIESVMQLRQLEMLGCDVAQGYLFSRPLDGQALCEWMGEHEARRLEDLWDGEAERVFRSRSPFGG